MATSPKRSPFFAVVGFSTIAPAGILTFPAVAVAQDHDEQVQSLSANRPKIWEDRGPIEQLDLFWGDGSPDRVPVGPFTFVAEDLGGTNPKAHVRDVNGVLWGVKWDEEAQSEVAASRLAWAMGLRVDETYYVETGTIVFPDALSGSSRPCRSTHTNMRAAACTPPGTYTSVPSPEMLMLTAPAGVVLLQHRHRRASVESANDWLDSQKECEGRTLQFEELLNGDWSRVLIWRVSSGRRRSF